MFICILYVQSFPLFNVLCQSALANLRAAIVALANSNSGASGGAAPGSVVLVSNLNEKVSMRRACVARLPSTPILLLPTFVSVLLTTTSFFLTCLLTLFYPPYLSSLVSALDLPTHPILQDDHSSCSVHSLWYVCALTLTLLLWEYLSLCLSARLPVCLHLVWDAGDVDTNMICYSDRCLWWCCPCQDPL